MSKITDTVRAMAEPIVAELGLELWDVEYVREAGTNYLRIYIDINKFLTLRYDRSLKA